LRSRVEEKLFVLLGYSQITVIARGILIKTIDPFIYNKIHPKTIDLRTRLWGINPTNSVFNPRSFVLRSIVSG